MGHNICVLEYADSGLSIVTAVAKHWLFHFLSSVFTRVGMDVKSLMRFFDYDDFLFSQGFLISRDILPEVKFAQLAS